MEQKTYPEVNDTQSLENAIERVRAAQKILQTGHFAQICGCCQWYGLCSQIPTGASI